jgi:hypothetical protein
MFHLVCMFSMTTYLVFNSIRLWFSKMYTIITNIKLIFSLNHSGARRVGDRIVVWFTTTYEISAYQHLSCEFEPRSWRGCDQVCQWLATGRWFSPGTLISSTNKTDCHDIHVAEILLKVALKTITSNRLLSLSNFVTSHTKTDYQLQRR